MGTITSLVISNESIAAVLADEGATDTPAHIADHEACLEERVWEAFEDEERFGVVPEEAAREFTQWRDAWLGHTATAPPALLDS